VCAPFDAIQRHWGYLHRIKGVGETPQLAPKVISLEACDCGRMANCADCGRLTTVKLREELFALVG